MLVGRDDPYSADGIFQIGNPFYDLVGHAFALPLIRPMKSPVHIHSNQAKYYPDADDLNPFGVPWGFHAFGMHGNTHGKKSYPVVLDINLDLDRINELVDYLQACNYVDESVTSFTMQMLLYNTHSPFFVNVKLKANYDSSGVYHIAYDITVRAAMCLLLRALFL
ncbi:hypothetical protein CYMTET_23257 [Cymbomonas tetramitiformis]|uniref:Uncharacterized protein n=1 Tax=Cymbomonas tetramitiformis TaxID=36881 RepID=A0AAE0FY99_9CHLO|nr:hypothetical protein CYMTET_23257 [Cymbomonas tetramitiformis]